MPRARKRFFTALTGIAAAAALVLTPLAATGASAAEVRGEIGELVEWVKDSNQTSYWKQYLVHDAECVKVDSATGTAQATVSEDKLTITLKPFDLSREGDHWELLVIKSGNRWNNVVVHPEVGVEYASPVNGGEQQGAISHWFLCSGTTPNDTPRTETKTTVTTDIDCESPLASIVTTTTTTVFRWNAATKTWVPEAPVSAAVPTTRDLTAEELAGCDEPEDPEVPTTTTEIVKADWIEAWNCGETTVTPTRRVTTTSIVNGVPSQPVVTSESGEPRELSSAEIGARCDLLPGAVASECVGDVPYLSYAVTLPAGFTTEDENPVTITFINPAGDDYVVPETHGLTGKILWPGASEGPQKMWPGWKLVDGKYVKTTDNFDWTRNGVTVRFDVNPTVEVQVGYPAETVLCANPAAVPPGDDPSDPADPTDPSDDPADPADPATPASLAVTGSTVPGGVIGFGALALLAGIAMAVVSARRRAQA